MSPANGSNADSITLNAWRRPLHGDFILEKEGVPSNSRRKSRVGVRGAATRRLGLRVGVAKVAADRAEQVRTVVVLALCQSCHRVHVGGRGATRTRATCGLE